MQRFLNTFFGTEDHTVLSPEFTERAEKFYDDPESRWEPVLIDTAYYVLRQDPQRLKTLDRLNYLRRECSKLYNTLVADPKNQVTRRKELQKLGACLAADDGVFHIVQKPAGGYDVRAYAHDSWIFIELPTFASIETGTDGINTTEARRRVSLLHIVLHELAHVAGYWDHDADHEKCIAWLTKYV